MLQSKRVESLSCPFSFKVPVPRPKRQVSGTKQAVPLDFDRRKGKQALSLNLVALLAPKELKRNEPDTPPPPYSTAHLEIVRPTKKRILRTLSQPAPSMPPPKPVVMAVHRDTGGPKGYLNAIGLYVPTAAERRLPEPPHGCNWWGPYYHAVQTCRGRQLPAEQEPAVLAAAQADIAEMEAEARNKHAIDMARRARSPRQAPAPLPPPQAAPPTQCADCRVAPSKPFIGLGQAGRLGAWVLGGALLTTATWQVAGFYALWLGLCELWALVSPEP